MHFHCNRTSRWVSIVFCCKTDLYKEKKNEYVQVFIESLLLSKRTENVANSLLKLKLINNNNNHLFCFVNKKLYSKK